MLLTMHVRSICTHALVVPALHLLCALGDVQIDSCGNFFLLISDHLAICEAVHIEGKGREAR